MDLNTQIKNIKKLLSNYKKVQIWDYTEFKSASQIATITQLQNEQNYQGLIKFWQETCKNDYFELQHPIEYVVITRAVANLQDGELNLILMIDEFEEFPFLIIQNNCLINFVITPDRIYRTSYTHIVPNGLLSAAKRIMRHTKNFENLCKYKDAKFGFYLYHPRPRHYLLEQLAPLININPTKYIKVKQCFYLPNNLNILCDKNPPPPEKTPSVFLFPTTLNILNQHNHTLTIPSNILIKQSLQECKTNKDDFDLTLWFGIPSERREWVEAKDGILKIIEQYLLYFNSIKIYLDGLTAFENAPFNTPFPILHKELIENLNTLNKNGKKVEAISLHGATYKLKISYFSSVDCAITESSSTGIVPLDIYRSDNCVLFGPIFYNTELVSYIPQNAKIANENLIKITNFKQFGYFKYHIPWQHLYNLSADILEKIKQVKIARLQVPPMEQILLKADSNNQVHKNNIFTKLARFFKMPT